ncbi:alpha/beta hydrolase [Acidipropionibacterium jensenii]|uniref:alpha/beta fold hydrolase n=1 Tax=Acidipropionibacterium jensenii TaxID=1749 RepID=UPI000BC35602|nr:alpha/beta hydrolase [Acidipropionibacterium jensenii]AZZ42506.1 alpha/beta hydrolase [Acidipropionibacterium jensenii]
MTDEIVETPTSAGPRQVRLRIRHGRGPAALLMSGAAQSSELWRPVVEGLPDRLVVSYDRPGMGGTRWPGRLPSLAEEAQTATALARRIRPPVILVAHSMAAFHAEAMIREHPDLVAGLVLVDPSVEWHARRPSPQGSGLAHTVRLAARSGLSGLGELTMATGTLLQTSWSAGRLRGYLRTHRLREVFADPDSLAMSTAELLAYPRQAWELMEVRAHHPWPGTATILLSAEHSHAEQEVDRQDRLARLLGAELRVVHGSRHLIMLDEPGAIAGAIRELS